MSYNNLGSKLFTQMYCYYRSVYFGTGHEGDDLLCSGGGNCDLEENNAQLTCQRHHLKTWNSLAPVLVVNVEVVSIFACWSQLNIRYILPGHHSSM